jgi:gamma-glutamylcyclotransferase (GGCT)/AIG2-like uncharacterized protein YtfP
MTITPRLRAGDVVAVYGLLRPESSGLDTLAVRARVRVLGPCVIPGRLIDLGRYPGLVAGEGKVAGDRLQLLDARVGEELDRFEDFDPRDDQGSVYRRARIRLVRPLVHAWVYLWNGPADAGPLVPRGDWLARG